MSEHRVSRIVAWLAYVAIVGLFGGAISAEPHLGQARSHWLMQVAISAIAGILIGAYQDTPSPHALISSLAIITIGLLTFASALYFVRSGALLYFLFPSASVLTLVSVVAGRE
ncbi:MAG: hypothetical protein U0R49_11675 [Fimbriimonadales bacterium]